jgi:hypothetical protein
MEPIAKEPNCAALPWYGTGVLNSEAVMVISTSHHHLELTTIPALRQRSMDIVNGTS